MDMMELLGIGGKVVESVATYKLAGLLLGQYGGMTLILAAGFLAWKITQWQRDGNNKFDLMDLRYVTIPLVDLVILGAGVKLLFF